MNKFTERGGSCVKKPIGIYLHIPFCDGKCPYCDFYSVCDTGMADRYADALIGELARAARPDVTADTLYLGGGTPPLLGTDNLCRLLEAVQRHYAFSGETTLEANPGSVTLQSLTALRQAGFNRISFGMQSAVPEELARLGRKHTPAQVSAAVEAAKAAGFTNISVDLMLGIPGQTADTLSESIAFVHTLAVSHLSAYLLKVEENTPFWQQRIWEECPDEEESASLYLQAVQQLAQIGFTQYEISNFAKPDMACRHNLKYWHCAEYLGFGPAAHGYFDGKRYGHTRDLAEYLKSPEQTVFLTDEAPGDFEEYAMLRLRLTEGLSLAEAKKRDCDIDTLRQKAMPYQKAGLLRLDGDRLALTPEGFLLSNSLIGALILK